MLSEHTLDQLRALRLDGMVRAIEDQASSTAAQELPFDDRLTMLVGNPPENPKTAEVEFSKKEVLREEVEIYRQPNHGCLETC
jgi:hypothetical protein